MSWVLIIFEEESFFPGVNCGICCLTSPCCSNSNCFLKILTLFLLWCDLLPVICSLLTSTTGWKGPQGWEKGSRWLRGMRRIKNDRTPQAWKPQISRFLWGCFSQKVVSKIVVFATCTRKHPIWSKINLALYCTDIFKWVETTTYISLFLLSFLFFQYWNPPTCHRTASGFSIYLSTWNESGWSPNWKIGEAGIWVCHEVPLALWILFKKWHGWTQRAKDNMGVSKSRGYPQNGWFIIENPIRMIWGYHYFRKPPYIYIQYIIFLLFLVLLLLLSFSPPLGIDHSQKKSPS